MNPRLSIIVPVYNTVEYIDECIQSIVTQDFEDFELLLIDDHSTDGSSEILDEWVKKDSRIKVTHKEANAGVSDSRNIGLKQARGDYIAFIDSDDWLERKSLGKIVKILDSTNADIVFAKYHKVIKGSYEPVKETGALKELTPNEAIVHCLPSMHTAATDVYIWDKVYRRSSIIINGQLHLMDPQFSYGEDAYWLMQLLVKVNSIIKCDVYLYNYRCMRSGNTWTKISSLNNIEYCRSAIDTNTAIWKILNKEYSTAALNAFQKILYYRNIAIRTSVNINDAEAYYEYSNGFVSSIFNWILNSRNIGSLKWGVKQILSLFKFKAVNAKKIYSLKH